MSSSKVFLTAPTFVFRVWDVNVVKQKKGKVCVSRLRKSRQRMARTILHERADVPNSTCIQVVSDVTKMRVNMMCVNSETEDAQ